MRITPRSLFSFTFTSASAVMLALIASSGAFAATITVNSAGSFTSGNCELRDAIVAANNNTTSDACVAGSGTDTIVFSPALAGARIDLADTIDVQQALVIDGAAAPGLHLAFTEFAR